MQPPTNTTQNTPTEWESLIASLAQKAETFDREVIDLAHEREGLILDAEMGVGGAAKRLKELDEKIAATRRDAAVKREAILQAQRRLTEARASVAEEAERARQAQLEAFTRQAIAAAEEFSASLSQAAAAGAQLKLVVRNMLNHASLAERPHIDRLLEVGPWMRAAEYAGLRSFMEFPGYTGLPAHIQPLDKALAVYLGKWLTESDAKE